jgi:signal peptidase I
MNPGSAASTRPLPEADSVGAVLSLCEQAGIELIATVDGNSMTPNLSSGSRVRLRPVDPASLRVGDVIAFVHNRRLIAHRIVGLGRTRASRPYVLTRGDARPLIDVPVHRESIVGVVSAAQRSDADWAASQPAALRRSKLLFAAMFASLSGRLLDFSPRGAAHFIRFAWRGWALMARLRGRPGAGATS